MNMATKKIGEKTANISLAGFAERVKSEGAASEPDSMAEPASPAPKPAAKAFTGAGIFMAAMSGKDEVVKELADVRQRLEASAIELERWNGAAPVQKLDARIVGPSLWANRHEGSFIGNAWNQFKTEILSAGGNVQPIKVRGVRPANTLPFAYEIIFGHRRHRACLELGLPVSAVIVDATDQELFEQMDRENRARADLTIYEQGEMYRQALEQGLYLSLRKLSEALGVGLGNASESVAIAKLPAHLLDSFESRLDIQRRWAGPLVAVVQRNPEHVLAVVNTIAHERASGTAVKSAEVFKRLTTSADATEVGNALVSVHGDGGRTGKICFNVKKKTFEITLSGLDASKLHSVEKAIKALIA